MRKNWTTAEIPDLTGKTAIVTGSNSGIGFETVKALAAQNAVVVMACRNREKANAAAGRLLNQLPDADIRVKALDLSDQNSVRAFAEQIKNEFTAVDLLINNAGVMVPPYGKTVDGFELQMGTNHLGHFALTGLLLDRVTASPQGRIVSVSSTAHHFGNINFTDLHWKNRKYKPWRAYGDSKIANLYFISKLSDLLAAKNSSVVCAASHPGWAATELQRNTGMTRFLNPFFAQTPAMGALPTLYAACGPDVRSKDFFGPDGWFEMRGFPKKACANGRSKDPAATDRLWKMSEELTRVIY